MLNSGWSEYLFTIEGINANATSSILAVGKRFTDVVFVITDWSGNSQLNQRCQKGLSQQIVKYTICQIQIAQ